MKFKDLGQYLLITVPGDHPGRYLQEMKRLEWIFIGVRWLWVPIIFLMAWLHHPLQTPVMMVLGGMLGICNAVACFFNIRIKTPSVQRALGIAMLSVDTLLTWGVILVFIRDFYTAAYAGFVYIILEAAIRFGLAGSLGMALLFILGLYGAFLYRETAFGVRFSISGYAFWTLLMAVVALATGAIVHEGKRQRAQSERQLQENTLLSERHRLARELHDTVLKTLQGLSFEARVLGSKAKEAPPFVGDTARYIEDVCSRTSREIREAIFDLRNEPVVESIGSQASIMLNEWSKATGIAGEFTLSGQDIILPPEDTRQIRNIVSEALTNVQRHAFASCVQISAEISDKELFIEISDNGHGLNHSISELNVYVSEGRLGIAGMRERVETLGGQLLIKSEQNGTRIRFTIPISHLK